MENDEVVELRQQIAQIASRFKLFECVQCSQAIQTLMIGLGVPGKRVKLYTGKAKGKYGNIYHDRLQRNISTNGKHEGVIFELNGQEFVFDNLDPAGILKEEWVSNFYCLALDLGDKFQIEEIEF